MVCKLCGVDIPEGATVCPACGVAIEAPKEEEAKIEFFEEPKADAVYTNDPGKGFGLASMIIGIVTLALCFLSCCLSGSIIPFIIIAGIVGIVLGAIALKKSKAAGFKNENGKAGLIMSIISTAISTLISVLLIVFIVIYFVFGVGLAMFGGIMSSASDYDDYGAYNDYSYSDYYSY